MWSDAPDSGVLGGVKRSKEKRNHNITKRQRNPKHLLVWDFPGHLSVKTSPSSAGGVSSISGWAPKITCGLRQKKKKKKERSNIVTDSIRTLRMVQKKIIETATTK